jgi:alpha-L-fucosidase
MHAFLAVAALSLSSGRAEEATKVLDQPRPADPVFEKWLPLLNANPATKPRLVPDPLPAVEQVPGPFSSDRKAAGWKEFKGPQWLYDGKIGIGLHWGPASLEGKYAWPAWARYGEKMREFNAKYGHPSNMGWKDIANLWRAEKFDAMQLGALFKASGFTFVAAQAAHHDRFDTFDSTYRPWNSVNVGPHRDLLKEWVESCRANGLRFGITDHSDWQGHMGGAFGADKDGPWAGIPYDGRLTRADGNGTWWDGLDPADFYGPVKNNREFLDRQWYLRSIELIRKYQPDIWWQDGNFHNLGAEMARMFVASFYNLNAEQHGGKPDGVVIVKQHPSTPALMTNYEIHKSIQTTPHPWMTDTTCYGPWFYDESCERDCIYTGETLVHLVADIVSRNGTLLLNMTLRPDGTLPKPQVTMLEDFGRWMAMNGESIRGTRPWHVFCDHGYSTVKPLEPSAWQKFKPGEVRYTCKDEDTVYAIVFGTPKDRVMLTQFCPTLGGGVMDREVADVKLLGWQGALQWKIEWPYNLDGSGLAITMPKDLKGEYATVFKITLAKQ